MCSAFQLFAPSSRVFSGVTTETLGEVEAAASGKCRVSEHRWQQPNRTEGIGVRDGVLFTALSQRQQAGSLLYARFVCTIICFL